MKAVLKEAALLAIGGILFAWVANHVSPRGLELSRDYFPPVSPSPSTNSTNPGPIHNSTSQPTNRSTVARILQQGLQVADHGTVLAWFEDARYQQGLIMFVDVRDDAHYLKSHIPGAHQFDRYRPEAYLGPVLSAATVAEKIVFYCNGGDCEDSEFAAQTLAGAIPKEKIYVYADGFSEWARRGLPLEAGPRLSGMKPMP